MDIEAAYAELTELVDELRREGVDAVTGERALDLWTALDDNLKAGGFPPAAWSAGRRAALDGDAIPGTTGTQPAGGEVSASW